MMKRFTVWDTGVIVTLVLVHWTLLGWTVLLVFSLNKDGFNTLVDIRVDIYLKRAIAKDLGHYWSRKVGDDRQ